MRGYRASTGPFHERLFLTDEEIETTCGAELRRYGLLPDRPEAVRIDRFVEKRFSVTHEYADLPNGVLGLTTFGPRGVQGISIARRLDEESTIVAERRIRSTLAHEAGHGIFHTHLVLAAAAARPLFVDDESGAPKILCRDLPSGGSVRTGYSGKWWEFQANRAIGSLLMPLELVRVAVTEFLRSPSALRPLVLEEGRRVEAVRALADVFEVNPQVAEIRLTRVFPAADASQMNL